MPLVGYKDLDELSARAELWADAARRLLKMRDDVFINVVDALKRLRAAGVIFGFRVVDDAELPATEAVWDPRAKTITIRRSVFEAAKRGEGRARFTIAHEIGHAFRQHRFKRNRRTDGGKDFGALLSTQEAEANRFAAAFLCPEHLAQSISSVSDLARVFGLSRGAAEFRLLELKQRPRAISATGPGGDQEEVDTYQVYMQAVLRQAVAYPDR